MNNLTMIKNLVTRSVQSLLFTGLATLALLSATHAASNSSVKAGSATEELMRQPWLPQGLLWVGEREPDESESAQLLEILHHVDDPGWTKSVEQFLAAYPTQHGLRRCITRMQLFAGMQGGQRKPWNIGKRPGRWSRMPQVRMGKRWEARS